MFWLFRRWCHDKRRLSARSRCLYHSISTIKACLLAVLIGILVFFTLVAAGAETLNNPVTMTVTCDKLCGRYAPSKKADVDYLFDFGDELIVTEIKDGWATCLWGRETCYCWALYLDAGGAGDYTVADGSLNVRKTPDSKTVLKRLKQGASVTVTAVVYGSDGNRWGRISSGYVRMKYLEPCDASGDKTDEGERP